MKKSLLSSSSETNSSKKHELSDVQMQVLTGGHLHPENPHGMMV